ncbi:MAG: ClpXP protease specificity-enhancing factor SspB [Pseudomonadota bacterium]
MTRSIDYGTLMYRAMRSLIQEVLSDVSESGLPGAHHFLITFDTMHPDVEIADWLSDRYPNTMTIVMQHWFENLNVTPEGFTVTLNFGDTPETLFVPFDAIKTFVDPSVEFGLRFESQSDDDGDGANIDAEGPQTEANDGDPKPSDPQVVSLDSFRK